MVIEDYLKGDKICAMHECGKKATYKLTTINYSLIYLCEGCYKNMVAVPMDIDSVVRSSISNHDIKEQYRTCGNCKYDTIPEKDAPCVNCIHSMDTRKDLWEPKGE